MTYRNVFSWLAPALLAALAFLPALHAGITPEDWGWLALTRHLDDPAVVLRENAFFTYFYRPVGLAFWWLTAQAFGADGVWHYAANLVVHAANAVLVAVLGNALARDGDADRPWLPGLVAGLAFACAPAGIGTAIWLSDRFDPLALLFGLAALVAGERALRRDSTGAAIASAALLLFSLTSKEVAYAVAAALFVRALAHRYATGERRYGVAIAAVAAVIAALALRVASGTATTTTGAQAGAGAIVEGALAWWRYLPHALFGFTSASLHPLAIALVALLAALVIAAGIVAVRRRSAYAMRTASIALVLVAAPSVLQAPIVRLALANDAGVLSLNLRFYYLAAAGIALAVPAIWTLLRGRAARAACVGAFVALCVVGLVLSHRIASRWTDLYAADSARVTRIGEALAAREFPPGCRIELAMPDYSDDVRTHIDTMVKGAASRGASLMRCAIFAGRPVYNTVVDARDCAAGAWPGLRIAVANGHDLVDRFGNLCTLQFVEPDHAETGANVFPFSVDAQGRVASPEAAP
jgi:hypothetical protein